MAGVLAELDHQSGAEVGRQLRSEPRLPFGDGSPVLIRVNHPGGSSVEFVVPVRNVSSCGLGFIHGSFLYSGTPVILFLRRLTGDLMAVTGSVVRSTHVRGVVHDVGVRFDNPVDLRELLDDGDGGNSLVPGRKKVVLPQFEGSVLYVDHSVDNRELMEFVLSRLGITVESSTSGAAAFEAVAKRMYDAIVVNIRLRDIDPLTMPAQLRKRSYPGPIVAVGRNDDCNDDSLIREHGYSFLLPAPLRQEGVQLMADRYLRRKLQGPAEGAKPTLSRFWSDVEMRPLIFRFLGRLEQSLGKIARLMGEQNLDELGELCDELSASAGGYGYSEMSELMSSLQVMCSVKSPPDQIKRLIEELIRVCESAMMVKQAVQSK